MAPAASKFHKNIINPTSLKRRQIKIRIFNVIAKATKDLATGVAGNKNNGGAKGTATAIPVWQLKSSSKQKGPRRGQIKIKIFKMIAKSVQNLAIGVAGGNGGGRGGCFSSPATVNPMDTAGGLKSDSERQIKGKPEE